MCICAPAPLPGCASPPWGQSQLGWPMRDMLVGGPGDALAVSSSTRCGDKFMKLRPGGTGAFVGDRHRVWAPAWPPGLGGPQQVASGLQPADANRKQTPVTSCWSSTQVSTCLRGPLFPWGGLVQTGGRGGHNQAPSWTGGRDTGSDRDSRAQWAQRGSRPAHFLGSFYSWHNGGSVSVSHKLGCPLRSATELLILRSGRKAGWGQMVLERG